MKLRRTRFVGLLGALLVVSTAVASTSLHAGASSLSADRSLPVVTYSTRPSRTTIDFQDGSTSIVRDDLDRALRRGEITPAQHALQRSLSLFHIGEVRARFGQVAPPGPREATPILRTLAAQLPQLKGADRRRAERILARPDDGGADPLGDGYTTSNVFDECKTHVCVHWVEETQDAPPLADGDGDDVPDWVERTAAVLENAWQRQVGKFGFRPPKSDQTSSNSGPNNKLDVYLADVGAKGFYGYVTSDDPNLQQSAGYKFFDFSTYMVIDEDFARSQFPGVNGPLALKVTVAHEFFHTVQGAYDFFEDGWFSEGTATWMEDQLYDGINDNHQYLRTSPLKRPSIPLDVFAGGFQYGNFIFWQYVAERFSLRSPAKSIRRIWLWADGSAKGPDLYSLRAVARLAKANGSSLRSVWHGFGRCLLFPVRCYSEGGRGYATKARVPLNSHVLGPGRRRLGRAYRQDHLTTKYVLLQAGRNVSRKTRVRVRVDLPKLRKGPAATLIYRKAGDRVVYLPIHLNRAGDGVGYAPLGKARRIYLVLSNASSRYKCWVGTPYSCLGRPLDDNGMYTFRASLRG
jgi:hypothetical protein